MVPIVGVGERGDSIIETAFVVELALFDAHVEYASYIIGDDSSVDGCFADAGVTFVHDGAVDLRFFVCETVFGTDDFVVGVERGLELGLILESGVALKLDHVEGRGEGSVVAADDALDQVFAELGEGHKAVVHLEADGGAGLSVEVHVP